VRKGIMRFAQIQLAMPFDEGFDYAIPDGINIDIGDFVEVPLGAQKKIGVVWGVDCPKTKIDKIKPIIKRIEIPPLSHDTMKFVEWVGRYLVTFRGSILAQILRPYEALLDGPYINHLIFGAHNMAKTTPLRLKILDFVQSQNYKPLSRQELALATQSSVATIGQLIKSGDLIEQKSPIDQAFEPATFGEIGAILNDQQMAAKNAIVNANGFAPFLLDGVTGSGKTEVYLEAIAEILAQDNNAQILILLPEISLTQAIIARIKQRFGSNPVEWHNEIAMPQKRRAWRMINNGNAQIIIGARSAIFLPFKNLKLIIVDEEHDTSYKQDDGLRYQARDLAVVRAKYANSRIVLASATPSLETRNNAKTNKYRHLLLKNRYGAAVLPNIELVNLKDFPPPKDKWLSPLMVEGIADSLSRKEQALLFLNRRGFAPVVLCKKCGHRMMSPDSNSWLVEHRFSGKLICHLTGYTINKPINCPECNGYDTLTSIGPGVERVALEAKELFPNSRVEIFSSDTAQSPNQVRDIIARMENGDIDILIGTQIVAKGHNFPNLTFVGIVDGDLGLKGGDPRAGERTYQILTQVAGRAGRTGLKGKAMIQTFYPENDAFVALLNDDREGFLDIETQMRAMAGLPPFGRLASLHIMSKDPKALAEAIIIINNALLGAQDIEVWGPAAPPIALIRGWHRQRYLIRANRNVDLSAFMLSWRKRIKLANNIRLVIDIEPYSFL
jgi:primosomal protein N' (replication factor Y) (superfamily II helicase)